MSAQVTGPTTQELVWFKSSYSAGNGGECVQVATRPHAVHVRDSKDTSVPMVTVQPQSWKNFVDFAAESGVV
jgi:hypothetical protein